MLFSLTKHLHYNCCHIYEAEQCHRLSNRELSLQECHLVDCPLTFTGGELGTFLNNFSHHMDVGDGALKVGTVSSLL